MNDGQACGSRQTPDKGAGTDLRICGLTSGFRFLFDISASIASWSPQFKAVRLASRPELHMEPEAGVEPARVYTQRILGPMGISRPVVFVGEDRGLRPPRRYFRLVGA